MALAIDPSTPAVVTTVNFATITSDSFTPPDGSLLLIRWSGNTDTGVDPSTPAITDNLGTNLTYSLVEWQSHADSPNVDGQAACWWAQVSTGAAMTITVTTGTASPVRHAAMHITVFTGHDPTNPIGAHGKGGSASASSIAQNYTAQASGGMGLIATCDWTDQGAQTAGTGCTLTDGGSGSIPGQISYGFLRRANFDDANGATNTLNVNLPGTSTALAWVYVEVLPPPEGPDPLPRWATQPPPWLLWLLAANAQRNVSTTRAEQVCAAPAFVAEYEIADWDSIGSTKTVSPTVAAGEVLAVLGVTEDAQLIKQTTPDGGGLTYTLQQSVATDAFSAAYAWTAPSSSAQSFTLTGHADVATKRWGFNALRFASSAGIGTSAKANVSGAAPTLDITTIQDHSAIAVVVGDWNAIDGASRTWRTVNGITPSAANGYELTYFRDSLVYTVYVAYYPDAGPVGLKTVGLSSPGGQKYSILAVEILGTCGDLSIPWALPRQGRRLLPLTVRRGHTAAVPPAQAVVTPAEYPPVGVLRRIRGVLARRPGIATAVPPQAAPVPPAIVIAPTRARARAIMLRRRVTATAAPEQDTPVQSGRTQRRTLRPIRGRQALPVPAQIVVTAPAYPPRPVRTRLRAAKTWRSRLAAVVPGQVAPPAAPAFVPGRARQTVLRQATARRAHAPAAPSPQLVPPVFTRLRLRITRRLRGRARPVVPAQVILIAPGYPPQPTSIRRVLFKTRRHRASVDGWMVPGTQICTTPRPGSGTTLRPTGTTVRPTGTGTTLRSSTGATTRPDTGDTPDPC